MSSLTVRLAEAGVEQSLSRNTVDCYQHWCRKLWLFSKLPASQWSGEIVRRWLLHLADERYSPVSRKQALCAVKFVFDHILKVDLGKLELPPMPRVRQTLRTIPSREEIGRLFAGMRGQARLMAAVMDALAPSSSAHMLLPVA